MKKRITYRGKTPLFFISLLLWVFPHILFSQQDLPFKLSEIRFDTILCCNLHDALQSLEARYKIRFAYDTLKFESISFEEQPDGVTLGTFLDHICRSNGLKFYINEEDELIHIVDRWQTISQTVVSDNNNYAGNPKKFNFSITGTVIDRKTRESLPFVAIMAKGASSGTTTNVDGYFTLLKVPTDTSSIIFSYLGYQTKIIVLNPYVNITDMVISMEPELVGIEAVTVQTEKQDILQVSGVQTSMFKMSPVKLNYLPNLGEKDILRSFQLMPGISAANENSSGLYVRGGTPDQVLVVYDGFTVYNVEHMFGFFSAFNSHAIKDVQLYKGGFDAKWGGRLASVVEITGKDGNQKTLNGAFDLSMMSASGFVEFPVGEKFTMTFAARRSWKSPLYNKIFDQFTEDTEEPPMVGMGRFGETQTQETKSYFYDLNGKATYRPNEKDVFSFSIYNGKDDLDNSIAPQVTNRFPGPSFDLDIESIDFTNWGNTGASVKWSRQQSKRFYMNSLLSYSNYYSNRERSTSGSFTRGDEEATNISRGIHEENDLKDFTAKIDFELKLSDHQQFESGFQSSLIDVDYNYLQNDTLTVVDRSSHGIITSAYLQDVVSLFSDNMVITPGIRTNYFDVTKSFYHEPRINFIFNITEQFKLKAAAGRYYQFAKRVIREDITEGSVDFWVLSDNEYLPVSSSDQYISGFSFQTRHLIFDVEGFYKELDNVTEYSLRFDRSGGPGRESETIDYSENFFTGTGKAKGIDFLLQKKTGDLTGWIGYTLSQVTSNIPEFGGYDFYASHDVTHEFKAVVTYKWRQWNFGANWIYATGKPYTAPEGGYQLTLLDGTTADYINVSVKNGLRLPDYHRLDLSANYSFKLPNKSPVSIGLSIFNLYNRSNVWYMTYEIIDNQIIETPVYYLGITPNITITFKLR